MTTAAEPVSAVFEGLPADIARELSRERLLPTKEAAAFCGISAKTLRRSVQLGDAPKPVRISARLLAWRIRDLVAWIDAKAKAAA